MLCIHKLIPDCTQYDPSYDEEIIPTVTELRTCGILHVNMCIQTQSRKKSESATKSRSANSNLGAVYRLPCFACSIFFGVEIAHSK